MSLIDLIHRKSEPVAFATATPATFATQEGETGPTVASVATVTVAKSPQGQTAAPEAVTAELLAASEEEAIRAWLELIEETNPATIAEVIGQCKRDADARDYSTGRAAAELHKPYPFSDDRRTCQQCHKRAPSGICTAATPGGLVSANRGYRPRPDLLQRCKGFIPLSDDTDQRQGAERWPGLTDKKGTK